MTVSPHPSRRARRSLPGPVAMRNAGRRHPPSPSRQQGFTLVELLVTLAILAILLTAAVPGVSAFIINSRLSSATADLQASLMNARAEAMKRSAPVVVAPVSGSDWLSGWSITVQPYTGSNETLVTVAALGKNIELDSTCGNSFSSGGSTAVRYDGTGFSRNASGQFVAGRLTFKASTGKRATVVVDSSGRPRTCDPDKDSGCCS